MTIEEQFDTLAAAVNLVAYDIKCMSTDKGMERRMEEDVDVESTVNCKRAVGMSST